MTFSWLLLVWSVLSFLVVTFSLPLGADSSRPVKDASPLQRKAVSEAEPPEASPKSRDGISPASPVRAETSLSPDVTGPQAFIATAYCLPGQTASGAPVGPGMIAADPEVLPLGSIVRLVAGRYSGIYTVLDTGSKVQGRMVDIWMPSREEARHFGVRKVTVHILRYGWKGSSRAAPTP